MPDNLTSEQRSSCMSRVKNKRTSAEESVAVLLRGLGVKYRRNDRTLPGKPDFAVKSGKVAIFVNGCFWHGHANCTRARLPDSNREFWTSKIATNKRRDRRAIRDLRQQGWHILTVWQCALRHPERVMARMVRVLKDSAWAKAHPTNLDRFLHEFRGHHT